jgi:RHS repeat-associated protein
LYVIGSIRLITDSTGALANFYDYDAFGNFETRSEIEANPYGYTAREQDAESGLHYFRARYYDPNLGRFLSEDPSGIIQSQLLITVGVINNVEFFAKPEALRIGISGLYNYAENNPQTFTDPYGYFLSSGRLLKRSVQFIRVLCGKPKLKIGAGCRLQPFNIVNGQYLPAATNTGILGSSAADAVAQLGFGIAETRFGTPAPNPPFSLAGRLTKAVGKLIGFFIPN